MAGSPSRSARRALTGSEQPGARTSAGPLSISRKARRISAGDRIGQTSTISKALSGFIVLDARIVRPRCMMGAISEEARTMAQIRHVALMVDDPKKLFDYYNRLFGVEQVRTSPTGSIHVIDGLFNLAFLQRTGGDLEVVGT